MKIRKRRMYADIALTIAKYGTCNRLQVGSVIVKNDCIIGTGFNGSARGEAHCHDAGCLEKHGHCTRCVHSETNAIINAAKNGVSTVGAEMFVTHQPCSACIRNVINAGIVKIYYINDYGSETNKVLYGLIKIEYIGKVI